MRSELDTTTTKDRVIGVLAIIGGTLFVVALLLTMILDKQRKENMLQQPESEIALERESGQETSSVISAEEIGLLGSKEEQETESVMPTPGTEVEPGVYQLPDKKTVKFVFAGDILLDDSYAIMSHYKTSGKKLESCVEPALLERMREADVCIVNNEFTYTQSNNPIPNKTFTFRAKPENVDLLLQMGVDAVSLANNHVYDFGEQGLLDTLATLENVGVAYAGAGKNLEEASRILYYRNDDIKIALVCATQIERYSTPNTKGATETSPGTFRCYESEGLLKKIREAEENSDFVIAFLHWGTESTTDLDWRQTSQAKECIQAGADAIVGAHPHVIQGIGVEEGALVFYSLGNFWFSSKNLDSSLLTLEIGEEGLVSAQFLPCLTRNCTTIEAKEGERSRVLSHMRSLSSQVEIDDNGYVTISE